MIRTRRLLSMLVNLLFCLALLVGFVSPGLAVQPENDAENEIFLPLVLNRPVQFVESTGALDPTFSGDGRVMTNIGYSDEWGYGVVVQPDGKTVIAGYTFTGNSNDIAVARYNPDGGLDTTFGDGGSVATDINFKDDYGRAVALQTDGKILVAGTAWEVDTNFTLVRYNPDGSLDSSFDGDGKLMTNFLGKDEAYAMLVQPDGKILVAGSKTTTYADIALARYNADGSLDTAFSGDGMLTTDFASSTDVGYAIALQGDLKIIVAGYATTPGGKDFFLVRYNADGSLDTTFGGDGLLTTDFAGGNDQVYALALPGDGKILAAGHATGATQDFALARYNADGSLDMTFDGDGLLTTDFGGLGDYGRAVGLGAGGKIVVAGYVDHPSNDTFALARYNADGSLDTAFAGDGLLVTDLSDYDDRGYGLALLADGRLLVAGVGYSNKSDFGAARYLADGSLDPSFAEDGILLTDLFGSLDSASGVAIQADGKIVVAGSTSGVSYDFALTRYNPDGSLDATFADHGILITDFDLGSDYAKDVAIQADGKIVVAGYTYLSAQDFALARYNPDGSLDTTFDGDGRVTTDFADGIDTGQALAIQEDGKIILAGYTYGSTLYDIAVARYNDDGSLDTTFDGDGRVTTDLAGDSDYGYAVALQLDGKIVVGGSTTGFAIDFLLARYNADGSLDTTFDSDGLLTTDIAGNHDACTALVVQLDGKILAGGYSDNASNDNFSLVRYNADGSLDPSFDGDGKLESDLTGGNDRLSDLVLQPYGKIVAVGYGVGTLYDFAVARYNPDGSWDTSFDGDGRLLTDFMGYQDYGYAVALQPNGSIVVAGSAGDGVTRDFALTRYK
ncbi:MAG TPA: delta-60 repeat domain-containing protein [Anaerolineales bacterium]|nr:delta-60 repeat domain-containing protein [Anaerolineales bacterium]